MAMAGACYRLCERGETMLEPPQILEVPAQTLAVIRLTIPRGEMMKRFDPTVRDVLAAMRAQAIGPAGPVTAHYFGIPGEVFDFELGFPTEQPILPTGQVYAAEQPAQKIIRTVYTGPFAGLPSAWGVFQNHIVAKGYRYATDFREAYLNDPSMISDPTGYRTELVRILLD